MHKTGTNGSSSSQRGEKRAPGINEITDAFAELERGVHAALETYSNVHRGSGTNSMVSTHLYEQARDIVLEYLGLDKGRYVVIFCTPRRAAVFSALKLIRYFGNDAFRNATAENLSARSEQGSESLYSTLA